MEGLDLLRRTVGELDRLVDGTKPEQLDAQTLCTEWKVRDLLNHLAAGGTMFAISAEEGSISDEVFGRLMSTDQLGDDYRSAVKGAGHRVLKAYEQPGVMDKMVTLPFGEMPAPVAMDIAVFDVVTHCCDLARATGQTVTDAELLKTAIAMGPNYVSPEFRAGGFFAEEQQVSGDASDEDKLLAFAGRAV